MARIHRVVDQSLLDGTPPWRPVFEREGRLVGETVLVETGLAHRAPGLEAETHAHPLLPLDVDTEAGAVYLPVSERQDLFLESEAVLASDGFAPLPTAVNEEWITEHLPLTALDGREFGLADLDTPYDVPALDLELASGETIAVRGADGELLVEPETRVTVELAGRQIQVDGLSREVLPVYTVTNYGRVDVVAV